MGDGNHLRRAIKAGLVAVVNRDRLRVTPLGYAAIMDLIAAYPTVYGRLLPPVGPYTSEIYD
jgi:hypothetical protein